LPVKFALQLVATGWVAVAVVDFQVKKLDPTGPENSMCMGRMGGPALIVEKL
jgi:hypothetical protein